ncbi:MAG: DUF885 domain-containing protein [Armatimonadota bacterium]|nr:DUF885 domain-containing protein [Armatimonadota bacterium]
MTSDNEVQQLTHGFLADYLEFYPTMGSWLGLHVYDGRAGDFSRAAVDAFLRTLSSWSRRFAEVPADRREGQPGHDVHLIEQTIARERFQWEVWQEYARSPIAWGSLLDLTGYLKRNYAPLHERLRALTSHLEDVPRVLDEMRAMLREPLAKPIVETARDVFAGHRAFYADDLPRYMGDLEDRAWRARFEDARTAALDALSDVLAYLEEAAGRADGAFAIGEAAFREMLRTGEMVDIPLDRLLALGEAEMAAHTDDVRATAARIDAAATPREVMSRLAHNHPTEERLIPDTQAMLDDLRRFLIEREIVSLPGDARPIVEETPPFNRWAFAMMDTAGPFETVATESYYYITPPDPAWPPERRAEWLTKFDYATLKDVSIHEAYPGHFVHFDAGVRRAPSMAAKVLSSYSFIEGWAHYTEEMMLEAGVDPSPQFRLAYLAEALVRQVRYLVAIRMHAGDMTVDQATEMFERYAYMEPLTARKEAVRGTFDPGYLNYTLGKYMVRRLRDDYKAERGDAFTLRDFHDRLIALGAPPVPLARRALLARNSGVIL